MEPTLLQKKSYQFALLTLDLIMEMRDLKEYVISKQVLRSGTAIGAMVSEAKFAESHKDFTHKLKVALKEANETQYWLNLLVDSKYCKPSGVEEIREELNKLLGLLVNIVKKLKAKETQSQ